jgi:hypothetical protein
MMMLLLLKMMTLKCPYPLSTPLKSSHGYCLLAVSLSAAVFSCSCALHDSCVARPAPARRGSNRAACHVTPCVAAALQLAEPLCKALRIDVTYMTSCVSEMTRVPGGQH